MIRFSFFYKVFGAIFLLLLIYNEFLIYSLNSWSWAKLHCKNETTCIKVLLVADPQLIGEQNEIYHSITPVSIWDSDRYVENYFFSDVFHNIHMFMFMYRYLRKTYSLVVDHFSPDVIIFLGDLFDEGSIANTAQYIRYIRRLFDIFTTEYPIRVSNITTLSHFEKELKKKLARNILFFLFFLIHILYQFNTLV